MPFAMERKCNCSDPAGVSCILIVMRTRMQLFKFIEPKMI